jgi:aspartate aminotransferase-like enzyme
MNEQYLERYEIEARRVKQREAARALLAALRALVTAQNEGPEDRVEKEMANARAAIAQAEAAGIKAEG